MSILNIDDIKDANSHNSAMALTAAWAKTFKKYALNENEELTDNPGNSFNIFLHLTAQGAAKMMYEQAARINEATESTAILPKSLIHKLTADELTGIFGIPASTTIAFCIKKTDILEQAIEDSSSTGLQKLVINKNMNFTFESHPTFKLPYDIIINIKSFESTIFEPSIFDPSQLVPKKVINHNIYAYYDMPNNKDDTMRSIYKINNQYISSREMRFDNETYIVFFLKTYQIDRKVTEFYVTNPFTSDTSIKFEDSLVSIEVFRKRAGQEFYELMRGFPEGSFLKENSYNFSYDYKRNSQNINFSFSKMQDNSALKSGDNIKIIVYTTKGTEGNIKFPYMVHNLNSLIINYDQDLTDPAQNVLLNIVCLAFARDQESSGGKNQLSLEEIRYKIIDKRYSRNILVTHNEIVKKSKELGLDIDKIRHDNIMLSYIAKDKLIYKNMILSTGTNSFYFDFTKKKPLKEGLANYYLIDPNDVFEIDEYGKFVYNPSPEGYMDYINRYNQVEDVNNIIQVQFPFFIRYDNTRYPTVHIYDFAVNSIELLKFVDYNEQVALDKIDIQFLKIQRNPFKDNIKNSNILSKEQNRYYINFIVYTSENTINKLLSETEYFNTDEQEKYFKQYINFIIKMEGQNNKTLYTIKPTNLKIINKDTMITDGFISYETYFETTNFITNERTLEIKGVTKDISKTDYNNFVSLDTIIKIHIEGFFYNKDINPFKKACIKYESDYIKIVNFLTDNFNIEFDINKDTESYYTWESDKIKKYDTYSFIPNPKYDKNETDKSLIEAHEFYPMLNQNGSIYFEPNTLLPRYVYLHKKGDPIVKYTKISETVPIPKKIYYIKNTAIPGADKNDTYNEYVKVSELTNFEPNIEYFTAEFEYYHKKGDLQYFKKDDLNIIDNRDTNIASQDPNNTVKVKSSVYTGIIKDVPWINRLYFVNTRMYNEIREKYLDILLRTDIIRQTMFDGALIYSSLKNTSGKSNKYKAVLLDKNKTEFIKNIALKIIYNVRFKNKQATEYKINQIIDTTIDYITNINDNNVSVDNIFDVIKRAVPDIEYINILQINSYKNGQVQTILNDPKIKSEILTISQKLIVDESGELDFRPDITVNVINDNTE